MNLGDTSRQTSFPNMSFYISYASAFAALRSPFDELRRPSGCISIGEAPRSTIFPGGEIKVLLWSSLFVLLTIFALPMTSERHFRGDRIIRK
jgi:hypothetical protein